MAVVALEASGKVWERCRIDSIRQVSAANILRALKKHHNDVLRNPDLQFLAFGLTGADLVLLTGPLKLYFLLAVKPAASTTNAWVKVSDSATAVAAGGDAVLPMIGTGGGGLAQMIVSPDGLPFGAGLVIASHTAVGTAVASAAGDSCAGFAIVGAR